jgi:hypothetical protein
MADLMIRCLERDLALAQQLVSYPSIRKGFCELASDINEMLVLGGVQLAGAMTG